MSRVDAGQQRRGVGRSFGHWCGHWPGRVVGQWGGHGDRSGLGRWLGRWLGQRLGHAAAPLLTAALALACGGCASGNFVDTGLRGGDDGNGTAAPPVQLITTQLLQAEQRRRAQRGTQDVSQLVVKQAPPYRIDSGDILSIVVWDHPELAGAMPPQAAPPAGTAEASGVPTSGFVVDHAGQVQFPYAGVLKLAGLTEEQARDVLATRLARYISKPVVTLRVQSYRSKRIYVDGEVKAPGLQAINDIPMTLVEALNRAGGALPTADQSRIVLERGGQKYQINLLQLMQRGVNLAQVMLLHGDVVHVPGRDESKVFVSGEVVAPKSLTMHNGRLTLNEAMGEAGGLTPDGDGRQVYVVRKAGNGPQVYRLDAREPGALAMAEEFELEPRDVVYVAATPLANWHRRVSLLFPGALSSAVGATR